MYSEVESTLAPTRAMHPARGDGSYLIVSAARSMGGRTPRI